MFPDGCYGVSIVVFFFFKQKTAYELRISDWSSDVCSSDLLAGQALIGVDQGNLSALQVRDVAGAHAAQQLDLLLDDLDQLAGRRDQLAQLGLGCRHCWTSWSFRISAMTWSAIPTPPARAMLRPYSLIMSER